MSRAAWVRAGAVLAAAVGLARAPVAEAKFVFPYGHPDLKWHTIETEHFLIHYPESRKAPEEAGDHYLTTEWSARQAATIAEQMWGPMCAQFDYYLKEKINIVLLNQSDYLEGFTIPPWDWIEVSTNPGAYFYRMRSRMEWFSDVLVHEFAHVVSLKAGAAFAEGGGGLNIGGLYSNGIADADVGAEIGFGDASPFWWTEGGAEYWSDNTGYNWWTTARDMNIRTTFLEDRLLTYDEWVTRIDKSDWGDGERGYQQGYHFGIYLRQRFGPDTYAKFALENARRWRPNWEDVVEAVTGMTLRQLYDDWVAWSKERYEAVRDRVEEVGLVEGVPFELSPAEWEFRDPDARDRWLSKPKRDREDMKEATGTWSFEPRWSDDGRWVGDNARGLLTIASVPEEAVHGFTGRSLSDPSVARRLAHLSTALPNSFGHGWDFVPGQDAVVLTGTEHLLADNALLGVTHVKHIERDGYNWKQLWVFPLALREEKKRGYTYQTLAPDKLLGWPRYEGAHRIPNTLRGSDPAVAPDGETVAFFQYGDGTLNLATIKMDGSDKKLLTRFHDGTWMQRADWSPDGRHIVVAIFRNFVQNLWVVAADGSEMHPLTWDGHEEQDAHWGRDGRIYFSADPEGIYNIYAYDPATRRIHQITNVLGGAEAPYLTPEGNLLFTNFTAHGWKTYTLARADFLERDVTDQFQLDADPEEVQAFLSYSEDVGRWEERTTDYSTIRNIMPPTAGPMLLFSNDSLTDWGLQGGFYLYAQDLVEDHAGYAQVLLGEDMDLVYQHLYQRFHPTFMVMARHLEIKFDYGYALDADGDAATTDDRTYYEGKNQQTANVLAGGMFYPLSGVLDFNVFSGYLDYGFKTTGDSRAQPFMVKGWTDLQLDYNTVRTGYFSANPRGGRQLTFTYTLGYSDIVYEPYYGQDVDDGELLDKYAYNAYQFRWIEQLPLPDLLNMALGRFPRRKPTLQVDLLLGWIDRNVQFNDEFRAGGRHPYFWGSGALNPNTQFAGYPPYSLSGETMAILNLAYRFPVVTKINRKLGPLYVYDIYAQVMGTAGNLWSFRPPDEPGTYYTNRFDQRVAYDPSTIKREIPFVDYAYKNSPVDPVTGKVDPNYLLYDAGLEVRVAASMFNRGWWNSFVRLAYGFNEIRGISDVNGDDFIDTSDSTLGDSLSNETEKPGLRVYVGLGTGW